MKYSHTEALAEVQKRESELREKKFRREKPLLGSASVILATALIATMTFFRVKTADSVTTGRSYGTMLINEGIGAYVLVAVAAFMAGVVITVLLKKRQRGNKRK